MNGSIKRCPSPFPGCSPLGPQYLSPHLVLLDRVLAVWIGPRLPPGCRPAPVRPGLRGQRPGAAAPLGQTVPGGGDAPDAAHIHPGTSREGDAAVEPLTPRTSSLIPWGHEATACEAKNHCQRFVYVSMETPLAAHGVTGNCPHTIL